MDTKTNTQEVVRLVPPRELFVGDAKEVAPTHAIMSGQLTTPVYNIAFPKEGGVLSYHVGDMYPVKAWPFKEAIYAIDSIKRVIINLLKFLISSPTRYLLVPFALFPASWKRRVIDRAIEEFSGYTDVVFDRWGRIMVFTDDQGNEFGLQGVIWKPEFYCDMVREFRRVAMPMAGDNIARQKLVETACMILEFDDAYRYRIQDGFGTIDRGAVERDPVKELTRAFTIMQQRGIGTGEKFGSFIKAIPFLFRLPGVRDAVKTFFAQVDLKKLCLDEIDMYRCLLWGGHRFGGMPDRERASLRIMIDAEWQYREKAKH